MNRKSWRSIVFYAFHSIGFILLYLVIKDLEFNDFIDLMTEFPAWKIIIGLLFLFSVYIVKTIRWFLINKILKIKTNFTNLLVFFLISGFFSAITPGRVGEFSKIYFLNKKYPVSIPLATSSVLLDRIWDVLILSVMAVSSMILLISDFTFQPWSILLIASIFLLSVIVIIFPGLIFKPILILVKRKSLIGEIIAALTLWQKNRFRFLVPGLITSLTAFLILAIIPVLFSADLNAPITYKTSISAVSISNILSFIPITIAGFGTRELVFTRVWDRIGYQAEIAVSVSTIYFIITYLGSILLGGLIYLIWFRKIFRLDELKKIS